MLKWFICPDNVKIEVAQCLSFGGCRMKERCFSLPTLRAIASEHPYKGVSPSMAASDARLIWLKAITDYAIKPVQRAFALAGSNMHAKLSLSYFTRGCIAEQKLSDEEASGIADVLEMDEQHYRDTGEIAFVLYDYKNYGSFKAALIAGITVEKQAEQLFGPGGQPLIYKTGKKKGEHKTKIRRIISQNIDNSAQGNEALQLNRYRILFEKHGFPISKIKVQAVVRDGGTYLAEDRGIDDDKLMFVVPIERLENEYVMRFYRDLQEKVDRAFRDHWAPKCSDELTWGGRRCKKYCEVCDACGRLSDEAPKKNRL